MFRALVVLAVTAGVGYLGGSLQSSMETSGFTERFRDTRETQAEINKEATRDDVLRSAVGTPQAEVVGGTTYDFGTMQHGETRSRVFTFRNTGDGPLNLTMGTTTCKCTVGDLSQTVLAPGEETDVKLTWTAKSLLADFGQSATIKTTDPTKTEIKLVVKGQIVDSLVFEPSQVSLGEVQSGEGAARTIHILNYLSKDTEIESLQWSDENTREFVELTHKVEPVDVSEFPKHRSALQAHQIDLKIKPGMPIGPLAAAIRVETNKGEDLEDLAIKVDGRVAGEVTLMGGSSLDTRLNRVDFGAIKRNEGASIVVFLKVTPEIAKTFEVTAEVVNKSENLVASVGEPKHRVTSSLFPIRLEIPKGAPVVNLVGPKAGNYAKVVVKTNSETAPEIPIYVRMVVTK